MSGEGARRPQELHTMRLGIFHPPGTVVVVVVVWVVVVLGIVAVAFLSAFFSSSSRAHDPIQAAGVQTQNVQIPSDVFPD